MLRLMLLAMKFDSRTASVRSSTGSFPGVVKHWDLPVLQRDELKSKIRNSIRASTSLFAVPPTKAWRMKSSPAVGPAPIACRMLNFSLAARLTWRSRRNRSSSESEQTISTTTFASAAAAILSSSGPAQNVYADRTVGAKRATSIFHSVAHSPLLRIFSDVIRSTRRKLAWWLGISWRLSPAFVEQALRIERAHAN